ncbi:chemotaxis protein CheA [Stutzerimonas zhaodongensis]|uniref:Chemotaxis protein CheA n=1 Tax=Stutzerimonas zhaodongensis TaxID=1176257 RepID=A0ABX8IT96_9GAMM|nr:chemotaxis protein CheA [Stutzerimonas zhaodongensis]AZZ44352.1 chemotaxis protein CheA [Pseudomonadaceae bacterium SI-3]QWV16956.1 chemotaxis protein CheA [Stutzerimonas zhaodongensis]
MLDGEQWSQLLLSFVEEARDLAKQAEEYLLLLDECPTDEQSINGLFRAMHTLKGSAGLFSLAPLVGFTHHLENLLMAVRDGAQSLSPELISLMLRCLDEISAMIELIDTDKGELLVDDSRHQPLLAELASCINAAPLAPQIPVVMLPEDSCNSRGGLERCASCDADGAWHISLRFHADLLRNGFEPSSFVRFLSRLGDILHLQTISESLPSLAELQPETCYLGLEIALCTPASKGEIEEVFEFIEDFCTLRILPPTSELEDYLQLIRDLPETDAQIGRILVASGLLTERELEEGLALQAAETVEVKSPLGTVLVNEGIVAPQAVNAALAKQQVAREKRSQENSQIRVAANKLDELINLVGELVISAAGAQLRARSHGDANCIESTQTVNQHVELIREAALKLRMIEIGDTFNRFQRVVRDVSQQLGKDIRLDIRGADTELDKAVIDKLADPLTHLVRNAIDHGIESAEGRVAAGKPVEGHLRLNAYHESGMIVIEVGDDGRGLNTARIREKAIARGLIDAASNLPEQDIQALIFAAGFSTAESVSDLSGRGVGLDVVRSAIDALRGTIEIDSREGLGCTFRIRLPLTLAIIDGFLVSLGDDYFVIPLDMVTECLEMDAEQLSSGAYGYLNLRGKPLPCLSLAAHFNLAESHAKRRNIIVVSQGRQQAGLIVDHLHGELQTVIKPLGQLFQHLQGIGGSTILGTGQVALILDIPSLFRYLQNHVDANPAAQRISQSRQDLAGQ